MNPGYDTGIYYIVYNINLKPFKKKNFFRESTVKVVVFFYVKIR